MIKIPVCKRYVICLSEEQLMQMLLSLLKHYACINIPFKGITFIPYCIHEARKQGYDNPEFKVIEAVLFRMADKMLYSMDYTNRDMPFYIRQRIYNVRAPWGKIVLKSDLELAK